MAEKVITHTGQWKMFDLDGNDELILDGYITLDGQSADNGPNPLVNIAGSAAMVMKDHATITAGYNNNNGNGGGVSMDGGSLTMNDSAQISDNRAVQNAPGGGVYMSSGTFIMYNGQISNNSAPPDLASGGGVCIYGGSFTMQNGQISNNWVSLVSGISGGLGGGVSVNFGGTFTMYGGTISGNEARSASGRYGYGVCIGNSGIFILSGVGLSSIHDDNAAINGKGNKVYQHEYQTTFTIDGGSPPPATGSDSSGSWWN
jgi:hypothetical protein